MSLLARRIEPSPTPARNLPPAMPRNLHPAAQEAAAVYSEALEKLERVTDDCQALRNDLEVERRVNAELQLLLNAERCEKERYMRYAVTIRTHLTHMAQIGAAADALALDCAVQETPVEPAKQIEKIEEAIGKVISENVAAQEGDGQ